ncbi:MAG TPA: radical SAM family heme chaperone HemW [Bacteroidales bacterium]|nr:radical SAM family heme chaperone HemW [Bacteroidales bacterium]
MAGIYIHFPFCRHKCNYCNFYSLATSKHHDELLIALLKEIELQQDYLQGENIETIYLGGGTPSLLKAAEIEQLLHAVYKLFTVIDEAEITLEANPDDLRAPKLRELKQAGINRLSIGVQSFQDEDLRYLQRIHTANQARNSIKRAQDAGFSNISIDLIYGIPTLSSTGWEFNLLDAMGLGVPHISAYALTIEDKTPMALQIKRGKLPDVNDEDQLQQFIILTDLIQANGYLHYEISNFCTPGMFSKHNTAYWQGKKYLGIGPSAHSYNTTSRQWNIAGIGQYLTAVKSGKLPFEQEILTIPQRFNEYIMTSLRTMWGCNLDIVERDFGVDWTNQALADAQQFIDNGSLIQKGRILVLSQKGLFHADGIAAELFRID